MLRRIGRFLMFGAAALVTLALVAVAAVYGLSESRLRATYPTAISAPAIPSDAASIERGRVLASAGTHCVGCHGANLGGQVVIDVPPILLVAPNLTRGAGGIATRYSDADWARAIGHGVRPDGTPLQIMPSQNFQQLSDADLGAIIAYVKSVPPVDNQPGATALRPLGRLLLQLGELTLPADQVDHSAPRPPAVPLGRTAEYGRYLSVIGGCRDCHGANFSGAPMIEPGAPPAANLTPLGDLQHWSEADFIRAMREGVRPSGGRINRAMPWELTGKLSDDELGALYLYLTSLPALPYNSK